MGFRRRFVVGLAWRLAVVLAAGLALVWSFGTEGLSAVRLMLAMVLAVTVATLWRYIQRTNVELARFVDAVRFGDLSQSFSHLDEGSGFGEIGEALNQAMRKLRDERHRLSDEGRFFEAVLDDAPVALLTVNSEGRVDPANKAARRLLTRHQGVRAEDYRGYGEAFAAALANGNGRPRLVPLLIDGVPQAAMVSASMVHRLGGMVRVVAVQPIQSELNAVEVAAQSDLVRVLTHEIMNSMTPVTSLAHTAAGLIAEADKGGDSAIADARSAVETLARRADGVMHFVETYRQISRRPEVRRREFEVLGWAQEIEALFRAGGQSEGVEFALAVTPPTLKVDADPDLLCQVLINLLRNASEAASGHSERPAVRLSFALSAGGRTQIEVADNGPGVPESLRKEVFLPFFTTKAKGTGVGLSLARQVVLAHGGSISVHEAEGGGALFRMVV
jgi:nitrogen fixation/metabolism regulation signal transduction histidine kinase